MPQPVNRGFLPTDPREFGPASLPVLHRAQRELCFLLDCGYAVEQAAPFVGNHHQLSARQRMALIRASCSPAAAQARRGRQTAELAGQTVYIDGFNLIITLEVALSEGPLLACMDGALRDLCGLHGTYRLIDKTGQALRLAFGWLRQAGVGEAVIYLDAPVSNSGRLRGAMLAEAARQGVPATAQLVENADAQLWGKARVITGDAVILDRCVSWVNLPRRLLAQALPHRPLIPLEGPGA